MIRECQLAAPRYAAQMGRDQPARLTGQPEPSRQGCCRYWSHATGGALTPKSSEAPTRGAATQPHTRSFRSGRRLPS